MRKIVIGLALACAGLAFHSPQDEPFRSASKVKATATATKPDADGKQTVTVTLDIDKAWHVYANPVNNEILKGVELMVKIAATEKVKFEVNYPAGKRKKTDHAEFGLDIYEGIVKFEAKVLRAKNDSSPLTIQVSMNGSDGRT